MLALAAVLGEMASTWPVAGAMFTWTFRICRTSRRLDPWARFLSWIVGSFLLVSHVLLQVRTAKKYGVREASFVLADQSGRSTDSHHLAICAQSPGHDRLVYA